jgi:hypothetical protein
LASFLWLSYRRNGMEAAKGIGFLMVSGCCSRSGMRRYLVNRSYWLFGCPRVGRTFPFFLGKKRKQKTQVKTNAPARSGSYQLLLIGWCMLSHTNVNAPTSRTRHDPFTLFCFPKAFGNLMACPRVKFTIGVKECDWREMLLAFGYWLLAVG